MGKFIGRDMLLDHLNQVTNKTSNELKGIRGEIEVGDLLAKYLPDDNYVIAQPVIGKYEPDFLVISPYYGFRLIEVKNWSLNSIKNVQSNGVFTVVNKTVNPIQQVRKHVEDLNGYLLSNHSYLGDPHKLIGYVTIQYGFNRRDIQKFTKNWDEKNAADFFTFHLFKDELTSQLAKRLYSASKFRSNALPKNWIEDILGEIRISNKKLSESEINILIRSEEIDQTAIELKKLNKETKQMIEKQREFAEAQKVKTNIHERETVSQGQSSRKIKSSFLLLFLFVLGAVMLVWIFSSMPSESNDFEMNHGIESDIEPFTNTDIEQGLLNPDNYVKAEAYVKAFRYDTSSGNKFLQLEVGNFNFDAVIIKDTKTPFIKKGEIYTFYGVTQEYKGQIELKITTVE
ncbi:NERD domain-containing protein [Bacillus sp. DJP31]|uniref:NERD domain-containing protein n=1 Tax=Bacillus sp. DJP31 TaxID=3409789 RepID=UPI003BB48EDE